VWVESGRQEEILLFLPQIQELPEGQRRDNLFQLIREELLHNR